MAASTEEGGKGGTGDSKGVVLRVTQVRFGDNSVVKCISCHIDIKLLFSPPIQL